MRCEERKCRKNDRKQERCVRKRIVGGGRKKESVVLSKSTLLLVILPHLVLPLLSVLLLLLQSFSPLLQCLVDSQRQLELVVTD